ARLATGSVVGVHLPPHGGMGDAASSEPELGAPGLQAQLPFPAARPGLDLQCRIRRGSAQRGGRNPAESLPTSACERPLRATAAVGPARGSGLAGSPGSAAPGSNPRPVL